LEVPDKRESIFMHKPEPNMTGRNTKLRI